MWNGGSSNSFEFNFHRESKIVNGSRVSRGSPGLGYDPLSAEFHRLMAFESEVRDMDRDEIISEYIGTVYSLDLEYAINPAMPGDIWERSEKRELRARLKILYTYMTDEERANLGKRVSYAL